MADNEKLNKSYPPRRNLQQTRPPPGVQKALQTFGVRDLREILDKKRQEQGESQGDKKPDPRLVKQPPPDPSYNYLKDPTRDKPKVPQKKVDHERQPVPKDREIYSPQQRHKNGNYSNRENIQNPRDTRQQQENKENNSSLQEKGVLKKNQYSPQAEGAPKKELRFEDTSSFEGQPQFSRGERHSFRGKNVKRRGDMSKESKQEKIENPVNIKIELSIETGQRNCTLDENTKIADIKHVPDKIPHQRSPRGGFRGRGNFRSRGRGRDSFHGRGASSHRGKVDSTSDDNSFNLEELQKNLPDRTNEKNQQSAKNENNIPSENTIEQNIQGSNIQNKDNQEDSEENLQLYDEYDQENEEYNDANENYDEYYSEYHNNSPEYAQNFADTQKYESAPESDRYDHAPIDIIDPNLNTTIMITSSVLQDREAKRSVEVKPLKNVAEKEGNTQERATTRQEM